VDTVVRGRAVWLGASARRTTSWRVCQRKPGLVVPVSQA